MADQSTSTQPNPIIQIINQKANKVSADADAASARANASIAGTDSAIAAIQDSIKSVARNKAIVETTKANGELAARNANINLVNSIGGSETQVKLLQELYADTERVSNIDDEIVGIMSREPTGIGVIDAVINSFSSIDEQLQRDAAERKQKQTANQISAITGATDLFATQNTKLAETTTTESIAANSRMIEAAAKKESALYTLQGLQSNAQNVKNMLAADKASLDASMQKYNVQASEQARKDSEAERKLRMEQLQQQISSTEAAAKRGQLQDTQRENLTTYITDNYRKGLAAQGLPTDVPDEYIMAEYSTNRDKVTSLVAVGADPENKLADSPATAQRTRALVNPAGTATATKATKMLDDITELTRVAYSTMGQIPRDAASQDLIFDSQANAYQASKAANIAADDNSNPYHAPNFDVLAQVKAVANEPLYKKVLAPMELKEVNPETIVEAAVSSILAKGITQEDAAEGIATIFKAAVTYNNTQDGGFTRYGLLPQSGYKASITIPKIAPIADSFIGAAVFPVGTLATYTTSETLKVDWSDITQVQNVISKIMFVRKLKDKTPTQQ